MSQTPLNLLTREGAVAVVFEPALEPEHYSRLYDIVRDVETKTELKLVVKAVAAEWGRTVYFD